MMRFIENEQRARAKITENVAQTGDIILFGEKAMRKDKTGAGGPGIDRKAPETPQLVDALAIDDIEGKTELALQLILPLHRHGGRGGDDDVINAPAQQQLAGDQTCFNRLAKTDVV